MAHNIAHEPHMWDPSFMTDLVVNHEMKKRLKTQLTNSQRREAILQCLVALNKFMKDLNSTDQRSYWWLEGGTLIGAARSKHFVPWDDDADVTMTSETWKKVQDYLRTVEHTRDDSLPKPSNLECGCLILDTGSFGSHRPSTTPNWDGIPGRAVNECTGNYVDIFVASPNRASPTNSVKYTLSQGKRGSKYTWQASTIFPLKRCMLDGIVLPCPHKPVAYLRAYYAQPMVPDQYWSQTRCGFVSKESGEVRKGQCSPETVAPTLNRRFAVNALKDGVKRDVRAMISAAAQGSKRQQQKGGGDPSEPVYD